MSASPLALLTLERRDRLMPVPPGPCAPRLPIGLETLLALERREPMPGRDWRKGDATYMLWLRATAALVLRPADDDDDDENEIEPPFEADDESEALGGATSDARLRLRGPSADWPNQSLNVDRRLAPLRLFLLPPAPTLGPPAPLEPGTNRSDEARPTPFVAADVPEVDVVWNALEPDRTDSDCERANMDGDVAMVVMGRAGALLDKSPFLPSDGRRGDGARAGDTPGSGVCPALTLTGWRSGAATCREWGVDGAESDAGGEARGTATSGGVRMSEVVSGGAGPGVGRGPSASCGVGSSAAVVVTAGGLALRGTCAAVPPSSLPPAAVSARLPPLVEFDRLASPCPIALVARARCMPMLPARRLGVDVDELPSSSSAAPSLRSGEPGAPPPVLRPSGSPLLLLLLPVDDPRLAAAPPPMRGRLGLPGAPSATGK